MSRTEGSHGDRLIAQLLRARGVALVTTYRHGEYEIHGKNGMIAFRRIRLANGQLAFQVTRLVGENPIPSTDAYALSTFAQETANQGGLHRAPSHKHTTYPDIFRRVAQLYDHHRAPDLTYMQNPGADPNHQPKGGSHGSGNVTQTRAPLIIAAPGLRRGSITDTYARAIDIAPTVAALLGVAPVIGRGEDGRVGPQLLRWQDGHSLAPASAVGQAQRAVMFVLDGLSHTAMNDELRKGNLPNIARLVKMGVSFNNGSMVEYPTVTWSGHNTLLTGATPGTHGVINNSWFNREDQKLRQITDGGIKNQLRTDRLLDPRVETLYEAVKRTFGSHALTVAINQPSGRGADISILDLAGVGKLVRRGVSILREYGATKRAVRGPDAESDKAYRSASTRDTAATAVGLSVLKGDNPAKLAVFEYVLADTVGHHEGPHAEKTRRAMQEIDRNIGRVLDQLERDGRLNDTAFIVSADHGQEAQGDPKFGGWDEAIAASGVKAVNDTRMVWVRSMQVAAHVQPNADGSALAIVRAVNDDTNAQGVHPAVAGATVTVYSADGAVIAQSTTSATGVAQIVIPEFARGSVARIEVSHPELTTETIQLPGA